MLLSAWNSRAKVLYSMLMTVTAFKKSFIFYENYKLEALRRQDKASMNENQQ